MDEQMVLVEWVDSGEPADNSDVEPQDFPEPQILCNLGYLVKQHSDYLTVAGARKPDVNGTTYDYVISIPREAVRNVYRLHADTSAEFNP